MKDWERFCQSSMITGIMIFIISCGVSCLRQDSSDSWLDSLYKQGKKLFFLTIRNEIREHPKKSLLTEEEISKILDSETRYERLYEILINIFYQKDEPMFKGLLESKDKDSKIKFKKMFLELSRFSGQQFIKCFFETDSSTEYLRNNLDQYKSMDSVDLVIRSLGYGAKVEIPKRAMFQNPLSSEFDKQGGLDGGKFRDAHRITKGNGARIGILDSGVDESHSIFRNTKFGRHFSLIGNLGKPWSNDASAIDWGSHGTLISSVAARYAPEAEITMYKFSDGETQNDPPFQYLLQCMIAASIYKAVHDGNDVISISASGSSLDVDYLRDACKYAYEHNRILISGTLYSRWYEKGNVRNFPAQYETVVSVTAAERKKDGSYGYWKVCALDPTNMFAAPNDIFGAFPTYIEDEDTYIPSISAAIPVVAALFALVVSVYPRKSNEPPSEYTRTVIDIVKETANPEAVGFKGFSLECGYGLIDAEKAVKLALELNKMRQK